MQRWRVPGGDSLARAEAGVFHLFDPEGTLRRSYEPSDYSMEDTLYRTTFAVRDGQLLELTSIEPYRQPATSEQRVALDALRELGANEAPTAAEIERRLAERSSERAQEQASDQERIAALAACPPGLPELADPSRVLAERVVRHGDERAEALLACRDALSRLRAALPSPSPAMDAALTELAGAARLLVFRAQGDDNEVPLHPHDFGATPTHPTGPLIDDARRLLGAPAGEVGALGLALLDRLEELLRGVIGDADVQGYVDANRNMAALLRAATRISRAAVHLAEACRD